MAKISLKEPGPVRSIMTAYPENYGSLGRRIEIGSKAKVNKNKPGMKMEFFTPTVEVLIGIGKDHIAHLVMDEDAWLALLAGHDINIDTLKDFKEKFL